MNGEDFPIEMLMETKASEMLHTSAGRHIAKMREASRAD